MNLVNLIEGKVKEILKENKLQSLAHRFDHFQRVRKNALKIAEDYDVDLELLEIACLLHDIDEPYNLKENHVERSLKLAKKILNEIGINEEKKQKVLNIIKEHSTENITRKTSIESKILFDADKIDGLGSIGISRVFLFCGQRGLTLRESIKWYKKKINLTLKNLQTKKGKEIAKKKLKYVKNFIKELEKELI